MPIRLLLAYLGVDYEDKRYVLTKPPHSRDEWLAEKPNSDLDFPNVGVTQKCFSNLLQIVCSENATNSFQ